MIEMFKRRRTQYVLGRNVSMSEESIDALIRQSIRLAPSAYHSQGSRAVILFGGESTKLWDIVRGKLALSLPAKSLSSALAKVELFSSGVGTVLFFEDQQTVANLQEAFPEVADHVPDWSEQSGGMAQFAVWTTLANVAIGASLQHYNPLIDAEVARAWEIPRSWKLRAQMPFGSNEAPIPEKEKFFPDLLRFRTHGSGSAQSVDPSASNKNVVALDALRARRQVLAF